MTESHRNEMISNGVIILSCSVVGLGDSLL